MEWVETTGRSVDEAKDAALDQLGVDESDAEFVVISEPRAGLFGRMRGEARVRARVRPTSPRPKRSRSRRQNQETKAPKRSRAVGADAKEAARKEGAAPAARRRRSGGPVEVDETLEGRVEVDVAVNGTSDGSGSSAQKGGRQRSRGGSQRASSSGASAGQAGGGSAAKASAGTGQATRGGTGARRCRETEDDETGVRPVRSRRYEGGGRGGATIAGATGGVCP